MSNKLWSEQPEKAGSAAETVNRFTAENDRRWDLLLAEADITGSLAHAEMLENTGLLSSKEHRLIAEELQQLLILAKKGELIIEEGVEDIHSQIELLLTRKLGEPGKKIHTARSRNDQVLLAIKLYLRQALTDIANDTEKLFRLLIRLSEQHKNDLLPGYTHYQLAMPSSFGLWFSAYAESLTEDLELLLAAKNICNRNPLGSAAGYGSSFPISRQRTTELLHMERMNYSSVYAQMTRGKTEKTVAVALAGLAATLSKFAGDVCLYMNQNFGFIRFPDELTTGSSIMPHKKNPDVFELIRGKCNRIQNTPAELTLLLCNLPSGYHRDLQLGKEILFPAIDSLRECLRMSCFMLENIEVRSNILDDPQYSLLFTVEEVNRKVSEENKSFRDAYREVAQEVKDGKFRHRSQLKHTHEGSIGNLCLNRIEEAFAKIHGQITQF